MTKFDIINDKLIMKSKGWISLYLIIYTICLYYSIIFLYDSSKLLFWLSLFLVIKFVILHYRLVMLYSECDCFDCQPKLSVVEAKE